MIRQIRRFADTGNVVRFLLSFVLAFALWAWVTIDRDPEQTYRASQVPVVVENLPSGLELVTELPPVDITLQGPRSVIQRLDASSIIATVDLSDVEGPGVYERRVRVEAPSGIRKVTVSPERIAVQLGTLTTRTMNVELIEPDDVPRNLSVTDMRVTPPQVTVTGVQQNVDRIARVLVRVDLDNQTDSFTFRAAPIPVDAEGQQVPAVDITPDQVSVRVTLEVRGKVVPVFVDCGGPCTAAEGFTIVGQPTAIPDSVLIDGPREALDRVSYIFTQPINTNDLTETQVITNVPLAVETLPEGVSVEPPLINVSVRVEQAVFAEVFQSVPIHVLNGDPRYRILINPSTVDVTIEGTRDDVATLAAEEIVAVVDVSGLGEGTHQVRPRVVLPPEMRYTDPLPQVIVTITALPTPTATTTAATTPAAAPRPALTATP